MGNTSEKYPNNTNQNNSLRKAKKMKKVSVMKDHSNADHRRSDEISDNPSLQEFSWSNSDASSSSEEQQMQSFPNKERSRMIPVQGDVEASNSSSSNMPSSELSPTVVECERSDDDDEFSFFQTPPYNDIELPNESFSDSDILISKESFNSKSKIKPNVVSSMSNPKKNGFCDDDISFSTVSSPSSLSSTTYSEHSTENGQSTKDAANKSTCKHVDPSIQSKTVKVFITYADGVKEHMNTIAMIAIELHTSVCNYTGPSGKSKYGFEVCADVFEEGATAKSKSLWLETNIKQADFVLVCISPGYSKLVEEEEVKPDDDNFEKSVNAQYIYRRIHSEYINNGSKNFRFIPILVSQATMEDVPNWLKDTHVYKWNKDKHKLIFRLIDREQHLKPTAGPPPQLVISPRYPSSVQRRR